MWGLGVNGSTWPILETNPLPSVFTEMNNDNPDAH